MQLSAPELQETTEFQYRTSLHSRGKKSTDKQKKNKQKQKQTKNRNSGSGGHVRGNHIHSGKDKVSHLHLVPKRRDFTFRKFHQ